MSGFSDVRDPLPPQLQPLREVAANFVWSWLPDGAALFRDLDPEAWECVRHNAAGQLRAADPLRLADLAADPEFAARVERLVECFHAATTAVDGPPVAYFSAEFGVHESLPVYAGGLGILAGDHLKSASDLGVPLVGVGILYRQGYFHQALSADGWQIERYEDVPFHELPLRLLTGADGSPVTVRIPILDHEVQVQAWEARVGRSRLLLLDTNRPDNSETDRWISGHLYGGDRDTRIRQEILLGIGGVRMLRALGIRAARFHMNEGHAAFLTLELAREQVAAGKSFEAARDLVRQETVFTTHTPVPAGNDVFSLQLMDAFFGGFPEQLGLSREAFLGLGRRQPSDSEEPFGMTPLALGMSGAANGVSRKHGEVSRAMWHSLWPGRSIDEVPIQSVTNGVHTATWMAPALRTLLDRYLPEDWEQSLARPETWEAVEGIPDAELWSVHLELKRSLIELARERAHRDRITRGEPGEYIDAARVLFEPDCLLLGFARRVAVYKRLQLLFADPNRALQLVSRGDRPVHILIAGKAHPHDGEAKGMLHWLFQHRHDPQLRKGCAFLAEYDIELARRMVQGSDAWLNLPRRPLEASGTSGMKAAVNAVLNVSILDGWWIEGCDGRNGWAVGPETADQDQDPADAAALYDLLENEVAPLYYDRGADGVPHGWVARMKHSLRTLGPRFSSHRMVEEYAERFYRLG